MGLAQPLPTSLVVKEQVQWHCGKPIREFNANSSRPHSIQFLSYLC